MDAGHVTSEKLLDCRGPLVIDGESFHDDRSHNRLTIKEVLAQSSNIGAIRVGQLLGLNNIKRSLAGFGIPYETIIAGDSADLRVARLSFGQTVSTTISSLARAYGTLAISGNDDLKNMLVYAVTNGTGRRASVHGYSVAGKTGTMLIKGERAKTDRSGVRHPDTILASFVGFVPADAPRYVIYAILENPQAPSTSGGAAAAPLFQRVASRSLNTRVYPDSSEL
jgi:cell division protein FtsI/penicillin-binding protein 2